MKYCHRCGKQLVDEAIVCTGCGCSVVQADKQLTGGTDGLAVASKVFLILACIVSCIILIPLAWCLPITITICNRMKHNKPVGIGLKICAFLFVSNLAGILLLCRSDDKYSF
jgi:hypothetical protein